MEALSFYNDCEIFVTGGSGVVGKALIEKLLRSCKVSRIYMLLRVKKNADVNQRLEKIRNNKLFRRLRKSSPEQLEKIFAISGDAMLPNFGISLEDRIKLKNVSIFFHCAATVRFDEALDFALKLNVGGTYEALKLAETMKNLKLFLHVSTFYSNPYLDYVQPKIYKAPMDWRFCLDLINDDSKQDVLDFLTKKLIVGFPNTYTFTKNLAESLVNEYCGRFPICIYRPSIVLFALSEPEAGFPTSLTGATGIFALVGAGILKTVYLGRTTSLDITPLDLGIKTMLFYGYRTYKEYVSTLETVPVYLFSSHKIFSYSFRYVSDLIQSVAIWENTPFEKCFLLPGCCYTSCRFQYMLVVFTKQIIPAIMGDALIKLFGHEPVLMSIVRKAFNTLEALKPFMFNNYSSDGISLYEEMCEVAMGTDLNIATDLELVENFDTLVGTQRNMVSKIREVLLNEDPSTIPKAIKIIRIKRYIYHILTTVLVYYLVRWLYRIIFG